MDLALPDLNGMEAHRQIKAGHPQTQVLALSMHGTDDYLFRVLESGASGYVLKEADVADLMAAITAVHAGGAFIYPSLAKRLVEQFLMRVGSGEDRSSYDNLTAREKEILTMIGDGLTNAEIAERVSLSVHTIQTHRSNIMEKLGLHNRAQLVTYAARVGLIRPDTQ